MTRARSGDGGPRLGQSHVDQLRFGRAGEVGDDALADLELLQGRFVAETKFGATHIWINCVPPEHSLATRARNATTVAISSLMRPGSGVEVGVIVARFQADCGAISDLAPRSRAEGVRWSG